MPKSYDFKALEKKWRKFWLDRKVYEPDLKCSPRPFYNLMMFPYPSAEGLHIGGVRTFTGVDIYGRLKRMQGKDVFEPIGLDGFGIHSENHALKTKTHPVKHAETTEKNFYRQLDYMGNGFAWEERLETYDPAYYKWTQWIFTEMFRHGLAYRKKQPVNWCPSCKTVLADEQVITGKCERCGSVVFKKDLDQWFFKITSYAERLLKNLDGLDWSEPIKIAQRNWIGKSEGAELDFGLKFGKQIVQKPNFLILHGYTGRADKNLIPWLKEELESKGFKVQAPQLPNTDSPTETEQVGYVLKKCRIDENTIIVGHSLGGAVAMKVLEKMKRPISGLVLVAPAVEPRFRTGAARPFWKTFTFDYDYEKIKKLSGFRVVLSDTLEKSERGAYLNYLSKKISAQLREAKAEREHFRGSREPFVLDSIILPITVFTTRPDTLFGATYMVLAPEHPLIQALKPQIKNWRAVESYIKKAQAKSEEERLEEGDQPAGGKTGVELKGVKAVNPATKKPIPVWVADYVLGSYGTGAIMAVPAHDTRDFDFAKKYKLPIKRVVISRSQDAGREELPYPDGGILVNSGRFDNKSTDQAKTAITKFAGGREKAQYRLRDWLLSRQRYWGPPIPMVHCENCAREGKGERREMPGWYAVPLKDLPVKLPFVKNFKPLGTGKSPLATVKSFYETKCPACKGKARRETDVSDTFLDSAWYFLRYPSVRDQKRAWDPQTTRKWLPVHSYIGGAEHAVLHLLYSRFLTMASKDFGYLDFEEPFTRFRTHGLITKDGAKMSKSRGNVVNPDEYFERYGADVMRAYLAFLAPLDQGGDFRDDGISGLTRFLERVWRFGQNFPKAEEPRNLGGLRQELHRTVKKVTEDMENLKVNTATSALMVHLTEMEKNPAQVGNEHWEKFLKLLAPIAPFLTEELWHMLPATGQKSIHRAAWPSYDPAQLEGETFTLVIQVNGKVRDSVEANSDISAEQAQALAMGSARIKNFLGAAKPRRFIYIPKRVLNIVL